MSDLDHYLGELGEEMRGISEYWGVDLGIVVGLNFAYELRRVSESTRHDTLVDAHHFVLVNTATGS